MPRRMPRRPICQAARRRLLFCRMNAAAGRESDPQRMRAAFEAQHETALRWRRSTARERIARIRRLREAMLAHREALYAAFRDDFGKPPAEVEGTELLPVMDEM